MAAMVALDELLKSMEPVLNAGRYAFVSVPAGHALDPSLIIASIREPEGLSAVVPLEVAMQQGIVPVLVCAWITLTVHSDLQAVGLTAAFAAALGDAGISCNVVAGVCHDHIFVPEIEADEALAILCRLQQSARASAR